ncbi:MAG: peptidoglycan DD-metalloendopeptidase family protein [Cyclobacteriaceae bacterium]|jgi:septal ring factor EnvC (AmiA/AmiB activator)|nr:peptidase M23 [Cytophagales bacterium]HNP77338.1 peptidoglycan DD-metalloendopeptidase family protein [Cyclobacteriaceae bacterium]HQQ83536.1 peptidoglycan DD-metalloendopeptidase family protein [Cyclobacteriaceae bacterium]
MIADKCRLWLLVLLILAAVPVMAQRNKAQLQKEKQQNLDKIKETEKILSETSQQKRNTLGTLSAVNQRIVQQEALILSVQSEIELMDMDISENNEILRSLQTDLIRLKEEYAAMVFAAQKTSGGVSKLMFLFSAGTFDQLAMRYKYMEQYSTARRDQAEVIRRVQEQLAEQVLLIEGKKDDKNKLLQEEVSEKNNLDGLKKKQNTLIRTLTKEERQLKADLEDTRKAVAKLDKIINDIIREEMERAAREAAARKKREKVTKGTSETTDALSASFEENKGKFPWPANGFISQKFGRQNHAVLRGIVIQNDGINIQTVQGEKVKTIFIGEVKRVAFIPTLGTAVIVSHGEYFTVYSGLKDVTVKVGQKLTPNQEIGTVLVDGAGISELRFQIRKKDTALDPQIWLRD